MLTEDFMLKDIYERIWDLARPYLNTRKKVKLVKEAIERHIKELEKADAVI